MKYIFLIFIFLYSLSGLNAGGGNGNSVPNDEPGKNTKTVRYIAMKPLKRGAPKEVDGYRFESLSNTSNLKKVNVMKHMGINYDDTSSDEEETELLGLTALYGSLREARIQKATALQGIW